MTEDSDTTIHDVWFAMSVEDRFRFIEENIRIPTTKGTFIPLRMTAFQRKWFLDGPLFNDLTRVRKFWNRICLKMRNVGASLVLIAVESVLTAWSYSNVFLPFVSAGEGQANDLLKHCKRVIENANFAIPLRIPLENQTVSSLMFENGSEIRSFAAKSETLRGRRSICLYLDEFSHVQHPQEILSAAGYFVTEGGMINILSTPAGRQSHFFRIYSDVENFKGWHRHHVSLFEDMSHFDVHLPLQYQMEKWGLKLSCPWLNVDLLENKRKADAPFKYSTFLAEACAIAIDEVTAPITEDLLYTNSMDYYEVDCRPFKADPETPGELDQSIEYVVGADFGADSNMTALVVFEVKDGRFVVCHTERFKGIFMEQVGKVRSLINRFTPQYFIGDETGLGGSSWISVLREGDVPVSDKTTILGVNYSKKDSAAEAGVNMSNKEYFINLFIRLLSEGSIIVPKNHRRLCEELLGMQKLVYEKTVRYTGKNGPAGSDDLTIACMQIALVHENIFGRDDENPVGSAEMQGMTWESAAERKKRGRMLVPAMKRAEFVEVASSSQFRDYLDAERKNPGKNMGFKDLI